MHATEIPNQAYWTDCTSDVSIAAEEPIFPKGKEMVLSLAPPSYAYRANIFIFCRTICYSGGGGTNPTTAHKAIPSNMAPDSGTI